MKKNIKADLKEFMDRWKMLDIVELSGSESAGDITMFSTDDDMEEFKISEKNVAEAKDIIELENKLVLKENPLLAYTDFSKKSESAMAFTSVFRFFEEMMDKKYEADVANSLANRPPCTLPDFFIDHLNRVYGLKKLAQKALSQMMISLKILSDQGHSYGKIICKLLQVFDPEPVPTTLALFITKARIDLNKLISSKKQGKKVKRLEEIHIIDAINLVHNLFENDKFSRTRTVILLKPKLMSEEEFLLFRICNKLVRSGLTSEIVFFMFDTESQNEISMNQIYEGTKRCLEMFLTPNEQKVLQKIFGQKEGSLISRDYFCSKINLKTYLEKIKDESLTVSKWHFLDALIEVYKAVQLKDTVVLTSLFQNYKKVKVSQNEFYDMIYKLDSKILPDQYPLIYDEALMKNSDCSLDGVTLDAFIKTVFNRAIGKRGARDFSN